MSEQISPNSDISTDVEVAERPWKLWVSDYGDVVEIRDANGNLVVGWAGFDHSELEPEEHIAHAKLIVESVNKQATQAAELERLRELNNLRENAIDALRDLIAAIERNKS